VSWSTPSYPFLEDRRALYNDYDCEIDHRVAQSVLEIRREFTEALKRLPEASPAAPALRAMRAASREYLDRSHHVPHRFGFMVELGRLRTLFGLQIAYLAIEYGIDVEDELAGIIPPELRADVDESRE
jgi:hypothetical protein